MSKERRHWTSDDKIKLLRRHLIEKVPISKICDEARLIASTDRIFRAVLAIPGRSLTAGGDRQPIQDAHLVRKVVVKRSRRYAELCRHLAGRNAGGAEAEEKRQGRAGAAAGREP